MMEVGLAALVFSGVNFLKYLSARQVKPAITQAVAWGGGILTVMMANSATGLPFIDFTPGKLNTWGQVVLGASLGGTASVVREITKALDSSDSAAKPPLIP